MVRQNDTEWLKPQIEKVTQWAVRLDLSTRAVGRHYLEDRSVNGRSTDLRPISAGNVSNASMIGYRASDIACAWMSTLCT